MFFSPPAQPGCFLREADSPIVCPNKVPLRPLLDPNNCSDARRTMFVYPARLHTALCLTQAFGAVLSAPESPRVAYESGVVRRAGRVIF